MTEDSLNSLAKAVEQLQFHSNSASDLVKTIHTLSSSIETDFSSQNKKLQLIQEKMNKIYPTAPSKIKLNIGGQLFTTTRETLLKERDTFFSAMFSEQFAQKPDEDGEFFIDRDFTHFSIILNYLRGIDVTKVINELSAAHKELLQIEVDFYQIHSLKEFFPMNNTSSSTNQQHLWDNHSKTATGNYSGWHIYKSINTYTAPFECQIQIDKFNVFDPNSWKIILGILEGKDSSHDSKGHYLGRFSTGYGYCSNGKKHNPSSVGDYGSPYIRGSIVTIKVETNGNISFALNGTSQGVAYTRSSPTDSFYVAVSLSYTDHAVSFVQ